jgi:hypothetical protein
MELIEIETDAGLLYAVPTWEIKDKHWQRIKQIVKTVDDPKERKGVKLELLAQLFLRKGLTTWQDETAFMWLTPKKRVKAVRYWMKFCKAKKELDDMFETFSYDFTEIDETDR